MHDFHVMHGRRRFKQPVHGGGSPPKCHPSSRRLAGSRRSRSRRDTDRARRCWARLRTPARSATPRRAAGQPSAISRAGRPFRFCGISVFVRVVVGILILGLPLPFILLLVLIVLGPGSLAPHPRDRHLKYPRSHTTPPCSLERCER